MRPLLGPREEARQHCQLGNLKGKPGLVCLIPVPHLSPLFYPLSLALPDSPRLPGSPPPHPPLEGGAWLHPRVSGLYAPSWQRSWGEWHPAGSSGRGARSGTMASKKVCIVGSGNWGSAIAKIVGGNAAQLAGFDPRVTMWVFEEDVGGRKLTEIINTQHENVKYLPGHKLPANVVAVPDVVQAAADADILIFVVPHQFIGKICDQLKGHLKADAIGISLIKGVDEGPRGLKLISEVIGERLGIPMSVLMGANIASEVADDKFCETTIGCKDLAQGQLLKELMQTLNFRITVVQEVDTVEICGALKNIVAVGAGFCDGLGFGDNTKAAVIRLGLMEMIAFAKLFCSGPVSSATFLESCGVADLITTCYGGRNRKVAEAFARTGKPIEQLEKEMLNGQKLQGPQTARELHSILQQKGLVDKFPLFTAVYKTCYENQPVGEFIRYLQNHPEHL
ncbi:glycerol-3-phosphate dehydrogenase [NAD(+)], cytoplasmic [Vicugna pacos]|uniref:Glycerol-3-phosphate dehydrogenase [NAD(+)] n=1 Tax=Vicugna pacos TaxID=30538 RepID=A0A6I9I439_VICPA